MWSWCVRGAFFGVWGVGCGGECAARARFRLCAVCCVRACAGRGGGGNGARQRAAIFFLERGAEREGGSGAGVGVCVCACVRVCVGQCTSLAPPPCLGARSRTQPRARSSSA